MQQLGIERNEQESGFLTGEVATRSSRTCAAALRKLGEHPGVDAVGFAGQRRQPLHLLCVGHLDLPAPEVEPVVHFVCENSNKGRTTE